VLTIVLKDHFNRRYLDHTTVIQDGTAKDASPKRVLKAPNAPFPGNGLFTAANVYVTGPRAKKGVNLTYAARATVRSDTAGPWNLSAGGASLRVKVDSGTSMLTYNNAKAYEGYGADELISGDITSRCRLPGCPERPLCQPAAARLPRLRPG